MIRDHLDFALLVRYVSFMSWLRSSDRHHPLLDAALAGLVRGQGLMLHRFGGRPLLDRAILHISRHVGPKSAAATMEIFSDIGN